MSSDSEQPTTSRRSALSDKKQARRAALDRLKNASTTRPRPSFLGADDNDDDDGAPNPFDGLGAIRAGAAKKRQAGGNADREGRVPRDPLLDRVFDDLFDLDGPSGSGGAAGSDDVAGVAGEGDDVEGAPAKKRRVVARMDETRLMGPLGFPKLREELKKVKIKGKGHEIQDLRRVLTLYQLWSHEMFPRTNLRDTLQTVEKLCHKRNVQRELKTYRELEKSGKLRADDVDPVVDDLFGDLPSAAAASTSAATGAGRAAPAAAAAARDDFDNDDFGFDADEEAILAELEREAAEAAAAASTPTPAVPLPEAAAAKRQPMRFEEEDEFNFEEEEALMAQLEAESAGQDKGKGKEKEKEKETARPSMRFEEEDNFAAEEEMLAELERASLPHPSSASALKASTAAPVTATTTDASLAASQAEDLAAEVEMELEKEAEKERNGSEKGEDEAGMVEELQADLAEEYEKDGGEGEDEGQKALREAEELLGF